MKNNPPNGPVADAVREQVSQMGYTLLEFSHQHVKGRVHVHCVLHRQEGIDLDHLTAVHRALEPRLEVLLETRDLRVEFSSPGIERKLKSFHEFGAFVGQTVRVLPTDDDEWIEGEVRACDESGCTIEGRNGEQLHFTAATVNKARLAQ